MEEHPHHHHLVQLLQQAVVVLSALSDLPSLELLRVWVVLLPNGIHLVVLNVQGGGLQGDECKLHMTTDHPCRAENDMVVSECA